MKAKQVYEFIKSKSLNKSVGPIGIHDRNIAKIEKFLKDLYIFQEEKIQDFNIEYNKETRGYYVFIDGFFIYESHEEINLNYKFDIFKEFNITKFYITDEFSIEGTNHIKNLPSDLLKSDNIINLNYSEVENFSKVIEALKLQIVNVQPNYNKVITEKIIVEPQDIEEYPWLQDEPNIEVDYSNGIWDEPWEES